VRRLLRTRLERFSSSKILALFEQLSLFRLPVPDPSPKARHVQIGARIVSYALRQDRKRLAMTIDERGLRVGAPRFLAVPEVEAFIRLHGEWVLAKLDEHASCPALRHLTIRDGTRLPIWGTEVEVRVVAGANRVIWSEGEDQTMPSLLTLAARPEADLDRLARRALQARALACFRERLAFHAEAMDLALPVLSLSSARTRWGSCSRDSGIRLNWRLIHLPLELTDYVAIHELAHLVEMNHSARFWAVVERACPDWRQRRAELKRRGSEIPLI